MLRGQRVNLIRRLDRLPRALELAALPLALLAIWVGSSIPSNNLPNLTVFGQDKLIHLLEYTGLGLALWVAGRRHWIPWLRQRGAISCCVLVLTIVLPGALWAWSDELHQLGVGRDCSVWDWVADVVGLGVASLVAHGAERRAMSQARPS